MPSCKTEGLYLFISYFSCQCLFYNRICKSWHTSQKHWFIEYMWVTLYMLDTKLFIYLLMIISNPGGMDSGCLISTDTEQELATRFPLQIHNLTKMTSHSDIWTPCAQFLQKDINKSEQYQEIHDIIIILTVLTCVLISLFLLQSIMIIMSYKKSSWWILNQEEIFYTVIPLYCAEHTNI